MFLLGSPRPTWVTSQTALGVSAGMSCSRARPLCSPALKTPSLEEESGAEICAGCWPGRVWEARRGWEENPLLFMPCPPNHVEE